LQKLGLVESSCHLLLPV